MVGKMPAQRPEFGSSVSISRGGLSVTSVLRSRTPEDSWSLLASVAGPESSRFYVRLCLGKVKGHLTFTPVCVYMHSHMHAHTHPHTPYTHTGNRRIISEISFVLFF